ncbi:MAG: DUF1360 domain-containing protein [Solirubrobacteraceae bacterium]
MASDKQSYGVLMAVYNAATITALAVAARRRKLPERPPLLDVALVALATQRLSRLVSKDRVTSAVRSPFTEPKGDGGPGEVEESPKGSGLRRTIGELILCPFCIAQWIATALMCSLLFVPQVTRWITATFSAIALADYLQLFYKASERTAGVA